jgi:SAM-dependent methyltransferase
MSDLSLRSFVKRLVRRRRDPHEYLRAAVGHSLWVADRADVSDGVLSVSGWAIATSNQSDPVMLAVNGRRFDTVHAGTPRPDLLNVFGFVPDAGRGGFDAQVRLSPAELSGEIPVEFDVVHPGSLAPRRAWQLAAHYPRGLERWALPDAPRIQRVHGAPNEATFLLVGYSNFRKIVRVLDVVCGRSISTFRSALDWGCGSGRLLRYLSSVEGLQLTAADIDEDNLSWCRTNLPGPAYVHLPRHPPSTLPAQAFDLLIGLSIFTHLSETVQFEWLKELHRVSAPGAILLMSIHGPAVHAMTQSMDFCQAIEAKGILDGHSHDLEDVPGDASYYRTTHHSHAYVRREWGRHFEIVDILPACIGNMQDLVVMRRR